MSSVTNQNTPHKGFLVAIAIANPIGAVIALPVGVALSALNLLTFRITPLEGYAKSLLTYSSLALNFEARLVEQILFGEEPEEIGSLGLSEIEGFVHKRTAYKIQEKIKSLDTFKIFTVNRQIKCRFYAFTGLVTCPFTRLTDALLVIPTFLAMATLRSVSMVARKRYKDTTDESTKAHLETLSKWTKSTTIAFYGTLECTGIIWDINYFATKLLIP